MTTDRPPRTPTGPADPRDLTGPFRHELEIAVRFADTDAMGHVNNATYLTYCEGARLRYWTDVTGEPVTHRHVGAESLILAEARITYRAQAFYGEIITVQTRATRIGRTSCLGDEVAQAGGAGPGEHQPGPRRLASDECLSGVQRGQRAACGWQD